MPAQISRKASLLIVAALIATIYWRSSELDFQMSHPQRQNPLRINEQLESTRSLEIVVWSARPTI